jgi:hypothetical protein
MPGGTDRYYPHFANLYRCAQAVNQTNDDNEKNYCTLHFTFYSIAKQ